jgi:2-succinyl-6-hydroxy-2,4-cyclohexadiene-1-carboxylate synthase
LARDIKPLAPCAITGYSMGARLALGLLVAYPQLFTRATLIGVSPGLASDGERLVRRATDEAWATMIEQRGVAEFADAWELQPSLRIVAQVPQERLHLAHTIRRQHSPAGLAWCLRTLGLSSMPDLFPELRKIRQPVTLVIGGEDAKFRGIAERMLPELEEGRMTIVPGSGHNVVLERPDVIRSFARLK